ncbi:MAG: hypothetical protein P8Z35_07710 [Ignavibacteriaceae bacterium]
MFLTLKSAKKKVLKSTRTYFIKSNRFYPLYFINCRIYETLGYVIKKYYSTLPQISSIYLAHGLSVGEIYPGLSDFDLAIIYKPLNNNEGFYKKLRSRWKRIQGFISARDLLLFTENEFKLWQNYGGGWEPLDDIKNWKLIYGKESRQDKINLDSQQAQKDRLRYSLSKYHSLINTVIKEEPNSPFLAIKLRRNLYKNFCNSVFPLNNELLSVGNQYKRLLKWTKENVKEFPLLQKLLLIRQSRFQVGEVSKLRFSIGSLAYKSIDKALQDYNHDYNSNLNTITDKKNSVPVFNINEVENKIKGLTSSILDLVKNSLEGIFLLSNGSPLGYMLLIVLKDGLPIEKIADIFKTIHVIFRIYDDPWFNEHFPAKVPIIYSKKMFFAHMELWPFHKNNALYHRCILYGEDLFESVEPTGAVSDNKFEQDILREKINLSRSLHQICLEKNIPALYDFITLQFPRFYLLKEHGWIPGTVDEAVFYFDKTNSSESISPISLFKKHGRKSIHDLKDALTEKEFQESIDYLNNKFTDNFLSVDILKK